MSTEILIIEATGSVTPIISAVGSVALVITATGSTDLATAP
jgi:hypothetical protein